jgi:hypothetical protein
LITIFAIHSPFILLSLFRREEREKGKRITKVVVKSHAFLLDPLNPYKGDKRGNLLNRALLFLFIKVKFSLTLQIYFARLRLTVPK